MVTVKNDAHRKQTAAKNHGVLFVENRVAFRVDFRSNREALFEEEVDFIFSHPLRTLFLFSLFGDFSVMSKRQHRISANFFPVSCPYKRKTQKFAHKRTLSLSNSR